MVTRQAEIPSVHLITAVGAAVEAGAAILDVYGTDFSVEHKAGQFSFDPGRPGVPSDYPATVDLF